MMSIGSVAQAASPLSSGSSSVAGLLVGIGVVVLTLAVVGVFVIVVVANRAEPDPKGRRPFSVYCFAVSFVTLWTAVIGSITVVTGVVQLIGSHSGYHGSSLHPIGDQAARSAVFGALITLVSLAVLIFHLKKGLGFASDEGSQGGPSRRVAQSYVAAVSFISILIGVGAIVFSIYAIFEISGPGIFTSSYGGRIPTLRYLIDALYILLVAVLILMTHRKLVNGEKSESVPAVASSGA